MNNLLKEAIADAKAVRETALANAKLALEEAFTPRLQSMLSAKLSEEEEMEEAEDMPMDEPAMDEPKMDEPTDEMPAEGRGMNDADEDPTDVHSEMRGMNDADEDPSDMHSEMRGDEVEEDLELEAILRELEEEDDTMDEGSRGDKETDENEDKEETNEVSDSSDIGKGDNKVDIAYGKDQDDPGKGKLKEEDEKEKMDEDDVDLEEIISALREEDDKEATDEGSRGEKETDEGHTAGVDDGAAAKDLEEAYKVIRFMKSKLNEVNLLNAKLLFSNKLFRNHSLNENQKMKVIENFDRATTLREVKLVFATLSESFKFGKTKKTIKESYASKASRSTKPTKKVLSEGNVMADRFKKLAGLI